LNELTETAQDICNFEIERRGLNKKSSDLDELEICVEPTDGPAPEWLQDAVLVCSFVVSHGDVAGEKAAQAQAVLQVAGIPSQIEVATETTEEGTPVSKALNVMAPLALALHAASILDRDLFNEEYEAEWRAHLKMLSDKNLSMLNPEIFCAGLQDRLARIKKAYAEEIAIRK
jgi:hypothetical protein